MSDDTERQQWQHQSRIDLPPSTAPSPTTHRAKPPKHWLGLDKSTGRVKWCPDSKYVKHLLLLPLVLLPIIVVLILAIQINLFGGSRLDYATAVAIERNESIQRELEEHLHRRDYRHTKERPVQRLIPCQSVRHLATAESFDIHEKEIFRDIRTSFIPSDSIVLPINCFGRRVNASNSNGSSSISTGSDKTNDSIENAEQSNQLDVDDDQNDNERRMHWQTKYNRPIELNGIVDDTNSAKHRRIRRESTTTTTNSDDAIGDSGDDIMPNYIPAVLKTFWKGGKTWQQIRQSQVDIMKQYIDTEAEPCFDFYQYACGNWEKLNPIPKDKAAYDTFEMLREILDIELNTLLAANASEMNEATTGVEAHIMFGVDDVGNSIETIKSLPNDEQNNEHTNTSEPTKAPRKLSAEQKAKYLYASCMNAEILEGRGIEPLMRLLDTLGGWPVLEGEVWNKSSFDWLQLASKLRLYNNDIFLMQWVGPDIKNSNENVIQFDQTSLGLPTRDYFLQPSNRAYLDAYKEYAVQVMLMCGASENASRQAADEILQFETELAAITATPEERVNVSQIYRRMNVASLQESVPQIAWKRYLETVLERPVRQNETVVVFAMSFMHDLVVLLNDTDVRIIANYMFWKFVRHRINNLDDRFQNAKQKFYNVLIGREKSPPRWKTCVNQVNSNMGMAVGAMFVRKYFDEKSKLDTMAMTHELQDSFRTILNETEWIDESTKVLAEMKVNGMSLKIGYPDYILNEEELDAKYEDLDIHPEHYFENILNVLQHLTRTEQKKLTQVVNRTAWNTAPAVVNAYYSRNKNQIMFPAGILQPPFYHRHLPRSLNFGGIGVVIGHELTHGFDDKGRLFDRDGNLNRWWSETAIERFHERANCLISQYGSYRMSEIDNLAVDGTITQGENIADNGGIKQAFRAYEKWLRDHCQSAECLEQEHMAGLNVTNKQLFFINFAQVWCGAMRPEATKNKMKTAVHSPGRFRVIGEWRRLEIESNLATF